MANRRAIWMVSALALSSVVGRLCAAGQSPPGMPTPRELLDRYSKTMDATQSFIDSYEATSKFDYKTPPSSSMTGAKKLEHGEHRADGQRVYWRSYSWGDINPQLRDLPKSAPRYRLRIEVNKRYYDHATGVNDPRVKGTAAWGPLPARESALHNSPFSGLFGFLGRSGRLDIVLREATRLSLRPAPEIINGSPCYVIDARTGSGRYAVWLDPEHGYQPAKAIREAVGGDKEGDDVFPKGSAVTICVDHFRFEQIDGVWVPMEADQTNHRIYPGGEFFSKDNVHVRRTRITLNPDHDKLGSFADPRDNPAQDPELKDGARIAIFGADGNRTTGVWRDGKAIDTSGMVIDMSRLGY